MMPALREPMIRPAPLASPREPALRPAASILIGDRLIQAVREASRGSLIGVRIATFAGHLIVGLDQAGGDRKPTQGEGVYARVGLPEGHPATNAGLDWLVERGIGDLCEAEVALVQGDGKHGLLVKVAGPGSFAGAASVRDKATAPEAA